MSCGSSLLPPETQKNPDFNLSHHYLFAAHVFPDSPWDSWISQGLQRSFIQGLGHLFLGFACPLYPLIAPQIKLSGTFITFPLSAHPGRELRVLSCSPGRGRTSKSLFAARMEISESPAPVHSKAIVKAEQSRAREMGTSSKIC